LWIIIWRTPFSAYAYSGFEDAAVVVMDGRGAWEATSIWRGSNGRLEHVLTIPFSFLVSIGSFYSEFTAYLGFQPNSDEWKVMGLAPYGKRGVKLEAFIEPEAAPYRVRARQLFGNGNGRFSGMTPLLDQRARRKVRSTRGTRILRMPCRKPANWR